MKFLLAVLGLTLAYADQISLTQLVKNNRLEPLKAEKQKLPENCLKADELNSCVSCAETYQVDFGTCVKVVLTNDHNNGEGEQFTNQLTEGFIPCSGGDNCGEAAGFRNEKDFTDFVSKYVSTPPAPAVAPTVRFISDQQITTADTTTIAQPMAFRADTASVAAQSFQRSSQSAKIAPSFAPARAPIPAPAPAPAQGRDFSGTNNQVQGVDQADLLKTDGTYIYTISNKVLSIVLAYPPSRASVVSKISLKGVNAQALFIQDNYLSVFGTDYSDGNPFTFIRIYDIRNRGSPFLTRTFKVGGRYTNGRKTSDGYVYLITNQSFSNKVRPWYDFGWGNVDLAFNAIFRYPIVYVRPQLTNIVSFNLRRPLANDRKIVSVCGESSSIMYMSERSIYLTSTNYANGQEQTNIRKIFIWRNNIIPFADGKVLGSVNNQFSLDQYGPYLRVATTVNNFGTTKNNIYSLGYYLQPYGLLGDVAPGERIFSARYVDRRLYLVTFRQVDPFFVISFANHRRPKILGQLKVPGFSRYLHPYDEETVIGLGRQADSNGRQQGLKISLFDVSDCTSPKELAKMEVQEKFASSTAEWEHKAFLFSPQRNLIVIPTTMNSPEIKFNGALAIYISKKEKLITPRAGIDHLLSPSDNFNERSVERSLYIEDHLYTKSKCLIRINILNEHCDSVKDIKIPCDQTPDPTPKPIYRLPKLPRILPFPRFTPDPIFIDDPIVTPFIRSEPAISVDQNNGI